MNMIKEYDPTGKAQHEPGAKLDAGKVPVWRGLIDYFPRACLAVAEVSAHGQKKYTWKGWESVPDGVNRYTDAMMRHIFAEALGEEFDLDSEQLHAAHVAWNALARLELILRDTKWDLSQQQS